MITSFPIALRTKSQTFVSNNKVSPLLKTLPNKSQLSTTAVKTCHTKSPILTIKLNIFLRTVDNKINRTHMQTSCCQTPYTTAVDLLPRPLCFYKRAILITCMVQLKICKACNYRVLNNNPKPRPIPNVKLNRQLQFQNSFLTNRKESQRSIIMTNRCRLHVRGMDSSSLDTIQLKSI